MGKNKRGKAMVKKMPKYVFAVFAVIVCLICLCPTPSSVAYADAIVEGPANEFYDEYESLFVYLDRSFIANGEAGSMSVKIAPGSEDVIANLENGKEVYMRCSCLYDGDFWGYAFLYSGWARLDQMLVLYDYVAFAEDHSDELYLYGGDYKEIKETRSAIIWPWPGADEPLWTLEDLDADSFSVSYAYKDGEGREWGFVSYLYGSTNIWVCLSDPLNRDIPAFSPTPAPYIWVSETEHVDIKQYAQENKSPAVAFIIILVAALVAATAVLIRVFWKRERRKSGI